MLELDKIYNMDCLEGMKQIPDNYIDLVLTDPPQGIENGTKKKHGGRGYNYEYTWDLKRIAKKYFDEIFRVSKNQIIFGGNYYIDYLKPTNCFLIWDKKQRFDGAEAEIAWTSYNKPIKVYRLSRIEFANKEKKTHPTQKPLSLFEWILKNYSKKNDIVLDCFMGSGTTAIACKRLNRRFIGFEIEKEYCKIAEKRLYNVPLRLEEFIT